jgi:hypothetical protein
MARIAGLAIEAEDHKLQTTFLDGFDPRLHFDLPAMLCAGSRANLRNPTITSIQNTIGEKI